MTRRLWPLDCSTCNSSGSQQRRWLPIYRLRYLCRCPSHSWLISCFVRSSRSSFSSEFNVYIVIFVPPSQIPTSVAKHSNEQYASIVSTSFLTPNTTLHSPLSEIYKRRLNLHYIYLKCILWQILSVSQCIILKSRYWWCCYFTIISWPHELPTLIFCRNVVQSLWNESYKKIVKFVGILLFQTWSTLTKLWWYIIFWILSYQFLIDIVR